MDSQVRFHMIVAIAKTEYACQGYLPISTHLPTVSNKLEVICQSLKEFSAAGRQGFLSKLNNLLLNTDLSKILNR